MLNSKNGFDVLVSIIVPAYKSEKYLEECLESLVNQTFSNIEIIVVLEEHDYATKKIVKQFSEEYKNFLVIEEEKNLGPAHTRNVAIKNSNGKFIAFCDADEIFCPEKIERQVLVLDQFHGLVYSDFYLINENGKLLDKINTRDWNFEQWIKSTYIAFSTTLLRKNLLFEVGLLDETLSSNEDFDLLIKLSKHTKFKRVPEFLATRRIHKNNLSKKHKETLISRYLIYKKYGYNFLAIKSLINGLIFSNIFYFLVDNPKIYFIFRKLFR